MSDIPPPYKCVFCRDPVLDNESDCEVKIQVVISDQLMVSYYSRIHLECFAEWQDSGFDATKVRIPV